MKMTAKTLNKVATLHNIISEKAELNRFSYAHIRSIVPEELPSWQTLKNHNLVVLAGQKVLFEEGFEEEFVVVNTYKVNF